MKYFVLGALASGMLLYGMSMLYGVSGSLDIVDHRALSSSVQHSGTDPVLVLCVCVSSALAWPSNSVPCPSICGCPTFITAPRCR